MLGFEIGKAILTGHSDFGICMIKEKFTGYIAFRLYSVLLYLELLLQRWDSPSLPSHISLL